MYNRATNSSRFNRVLKTSCNEFNCYNNTVEFECTDAFFSVGAQSYGADLIRGFVIDGVLELNYIDTTYAVCSYANGKLSMRTTYANSATAWVKIMYM